MQKVFTFIPGQLYLSLIARKAWAATTKDQQYVKLQGLGRTVNDHAHRKEIVAGNLEKFLNRGQFPSTSPKLFY